MSVYINTCCACLSDEYVTEISEFDANNITILSKLQSLVPEAEWFDNFKICIKCLESLDNIIDFKNMCLRSYLKRCEEEQKNAENHIEFEDVDEDFFIKQEEESEEETEFSNESDTYSIETELCAGFIMDETTSNTNPEVFSDTLVESENDSVMESEHDSLVKSEQDNLDECEEDSLVKSEDDNLGESEHEILDETDHDSPFETKYENDDTKIELNASLNLTVLKSETPDIEITFDDSEIWFTCPSCRHIFSNDKLLNEHIESKECLSIEERTKTANTEPKIELEIEQCLNLMGLSNETTNEDTANVLPDDFSDEEQENYDFDNTYVKSEEVATYLELNEAKNEPTSDEIDFKNIPGNYAESDIMKSAKNPESAIIEIITDDKTTPVDVNVSTDNNESINDFEDNNDTINAHEDNSNRMNVSEYNNDTINASKDKSNRLNTSEHNNETINASEDHYETTNACEDYYETIDASKDNNETTNVSEDNYDTINDTEDNIDLINASKDNSDKVNAVKDNIDTINASKDNNKTKKPEKRNEPSKKNQLNASPRKKTKWKIQLPGLRNKSAKTRIVANKRSTRNIQKTNKTALNIKKTLKSDKKALPEIRKTRTLLKNNNDISNHQLPAKNLPPLKNTKEKTPNPRKRKTDPPQEAPLPKKPNGTNPAIPTCIKCTRQFTHERILNPHFIICNGHAPSDKSEVMSTCPLCKRVFLNLAAVKNHTFNVHKLNLDQVNICQVCFKQFSSAQELSAHVHTSSEVANVTRKCLKCPQKFKTKAELSEHCFKVHKIVFKGEATCEVCCEVFSDLQDVVKHLEGEHKVTRQELVLPFVCPVCSGRFKAELLSNHIKTHFEGHSQGHKRALKQLQCQFCSLRCPTEETLVQHFDKEHKSLKKKVLKPFLCFYCDFKSIRLRILNCHTQKMHVRSLGPSANEPYISCGTCNESFPSEHQIFEHCKKEHSMKRNEIYPYACQFCPTVFATLKRCQGHLEVHKRGKTLPTTFFSSKDQKTHVKAKKRRPSSNVSKNQTISSVSPSKNNLGCTHCDKTFEQRSELLEHLENVLSNKGIDCRNCSRTFYSQGEAAEHGIMCSTKCPECSTVFKTVAQMNRHFKVHSMNLWSCKFCEVFFNNRNDLVKHLKSKRHKIIAKNLTENKVMSRGFSCNDCSESFTSERELSSHEYSVHNFVKIVPKY